MRMVEGVPMEYKYEWITVEKNVPIKILHHTSDEIDFVPRHWHDSIEISYVLSGKLDEVYIEGTRYSPERGDIVLINSNQIHSLSLSVGHNRRALSVFIPSAFVKENYPEFDTIAFDCISIQEKDERRRGHFEELRVNLEAILDAFTRYDCDPLAHIRIKALSYDLIHLLLKNFKVSRKGSGNIKTSKYLDRLTQITDYLKEHYHHDISIDQLSREFGLCAEYLSRFFQKHVGMTILSYLNAIRLERAYRDLMNTDRSITHIAYEHGFPNEKSFNRVFKSVYHSTPNEYRKKHRKVQNA